MTRVVAPGKECLAAHRTAVAGSRVQRQFSHDAILSGVEAGLVKRLIDQNLLRLDEVHRLIPASTFARGARRPQALTRRSRPGCATAPDQGLRPRGVRRYRAAETWLSETNPALGNRIPADLLLTDEGSRAVETVLRRIDYGDYS